MLTRDLKLISVIVPAYMQEKSIVIDITNIISVLSELDYDYEIIVVVDGEVDKTKEKIETAHLKGVRVYGYKQNHGKGYAVRYGMVRSKGDIISFIDAGADLDPIGLKMLLNHFEWYDADIVVGSKWHPVSKVDFPFWRKFISKVYGFYVKLLFGLRVEDTQLGMKLFKRSVLEKVMPRLLVKKFAMDIEILAVAHKLGFTRIYEAPIELKWHGEKSMLEKQLFKTIWNMFLDTLAVFYRLKILHYYDDDSKRKWRFDKDLEMRINIG